ncbi:hypothetical protein [Actinomyces faecalis]|uniref:hypothetical protein n=1 Tax=Actinomyces faecalis TaxID=2722820 RepID=UPI001556BDBE|nr:hypothetical protein [Actinomyces faecalis]
MNKETFTLTIDGTSWQIPWDHHYRIMQDLDELFANGKALITYGVGDHHQVLYLNHPRVIHVEC